MMWTYGAIPVRNQKLLQESFSAFHEHFIDTRHLGPRYPHDPVPFSQWMGMILTTGAAKIQDSTMTPGGLRRSHDHVQLA